MKKITRYEANDGSIHDTAFKADMRDDLLAKISAIMAPLGEEYDDEHCEFANGRGWIQHNPEEVAQIKTYLIKAGEPYLDWWYKKQTNLIDAHPSWFLRMLDGGCLPLERAWQRLSCISKDGKEFGQPFFATHPYKATGGEIKR